MKQSILAVSALILICYMSVPAFAGVLTCTGCHGLKGSVDIRPVDAAYRNSSTGGFVGSHQTHRGATDNQAVCSVCHKNENYTSGHRDGKIQLAWKSIGNYSSQHGHYDTTRPYTIANGLVYFNQTSLPQRATCSNVACHFETTTPAWGTAPPWADSPPSTITCGNCHHAPPDGKSPDYTYGAAGSHARHVAYYPGIANCAKCHDDHNTVGRSAYAHATSAGRRPLAMSLHDPLGNPAGVYSNPAVTGYLPSQAANHAFGTCSLTYCHSSGQSDKAGVGISRVTPVFGISRVTPVWGIFTSLSQRLECGSCHNNMKTFLNTSSGSHALHANSANANLDCSQCHLGYTATTVNVATHVNKKIDINFTVSEFYPTRPVYSKYSADGFAPGKGYYGTCSSTLCHGSWNPTWGGNTARPPCYKCHGSTSTTNDYLTHFSSATIAPGGGLNGRDTAGNTSPTSPRVGAHLAHMTAPDNLSRPVHCGECHIVRTSISEVTAHREYSTARIDFGPLARSAGHSPVTARINGVITCDNVYCHQGSRPAGSGPNQRGNIPTIWEFNKFILDRTTIAGTCANKCHGLPPGAGLTGDTHQALSPVTTVEGLTACSSQVGGTGCHPTLKTRPGVTNFTNLTSIFVNQGILHINGLVDGGNCVGCHSALQGNRLATAALFSASSHHYQGAALDGKVCYNCHWEANVDGSINATYHRGGTLASGAKVELVVWGTYTTRPTVYQLNGTAIQYQSGGAAETPRSETAKLNTHCLGCHNVTNATTQPFSNAGDTSMTSKYAWDSLSIEARYAQTGTTTWGKYPTVTNAAPKNITKAFSAHGRADLNKRGWNTTTGWDGALTDTSGSSNVLCFDCHNSHGSTVVGVTSRYSSATGRGRGAILKDTVAGKGGYTVAYKPYSGGSVATKNKRNPGASLCYDCHLNQTATTTPWGYGSTFGAGQAILGYWDAPLYNGGYTITGAETRYPYKATAQKSGHFGASLPLASTPAHNIGGLCTPCHDPHGVSPSLGANQQYAVPLLKGTWLTSPYKEDVAPADSKAYTGLPYKRGMTFHIDQNTFGSGVNNSAPSGITQTVEQFAGLCLGCHAKTSLTTATTPAAPNAWKSKNRIHEAVKGWKTSSDITQHGYSCSKCHTPHTDAGLPRLLVTNCLDGKHKGQKANNPTATLSFISGGSGISGYGDGVGRIPGYYASSPYYKKWGYGAPPGGIPKSNPLACHEGNTGSGTDQHWNAVSPW